MISTKGVVRIITKTVFGPIVLLALISAASISSFGSAKGQPHDPYGYAQARTAVITLRVYDGVKWRSTQASGFLAHMDGYILTVKHIVPDAWRHYLKDPSRWKDLDFSGRIGGPTANERPLRPVQSYPGSADALVLEVADRRPDEEFAFFPIVDASRVPAAEIAIAGYPNLTDAMKRKPTTLDAPCARASQSCGVNLKLVEGFSGSPVIWNDGITVVGMLTKSTTRATDDSTFVHLAFLSHWLEKLVGVKPPGPLPTLTRTALPSLDDLGGQVVCDVADSGYIPLLSHKLIALPNYLEVAGRSSRQTFSLVGDVVDGFDHLHVTSKVNADCSTDIYAINPTTEAGPSSVPTRLEATQNVYSTSMIVPPGDFLVPVAQSEKINIGVGRVITLKVENPSAISLDFTDPTFLTRLIDTKVERESLFLVDEILVSDILSEQNTGRGAEIDWKAASKVDFHKRFKGIGSVMGVKMKRIDVTRWPYAFKAGDTYSEPGAFAFSEAYKKLLKVDFRPEKKFFDIDPAENGFEVVFHSPLTNPTRRILISSRVPPQDSNIITIKLAYPVNTHDRYM